MTTKLFESVLGIAEPWLVVSVEPDFSGRLNGFTLLFEAFILMLSGQIPFAAVSRILRKTQLPSHQSSCWASHLESLKPISGRRARFLFLKICIFNNLNSNEKFAVAIA